VAASWKELPARTGPRRAGAAQAFVLTTKTEVARTLQHTACRAPVARVHHFSNMERAMNWDRVQGNWKQVTGKVKQQWGKLTDDTIATINGEREELVGKIQEAYGITRDEADHQVREWEKREKLN
jgi:uncharacterized protein YjbJ (UPF0337 family)